VAKADAKIAEKAAKADAKSAEKAAKADAKKARTRLTGEHEGHQDTLHPNDFSDAKLNRYFSELFRIADTNGDGVLQPSELEDLLNSCGMELSPKRIAEAIRRADTNGDGAIQYEEFLPMMVAIAQNTPRYLHSPRYLRKGAFKAAKEALRKKTTQDGPAPDLSAVTIVPPVVPVLDLPSPPEEQAVNEEEDLPEQIKYSLDQLNCMGFGTPLANRHALAAANGDIEVAVDILLTSDYSMVNLDDGEESPPSYRTATKSSEGQ